MCAKSLWGSLEDIERVRTPAGILREQANMLSEVTKGILMGEVIKGKGMYANQMSATLNIIAPALDNYTYEILSRNAK